MTAAPLLHVCGLTLRAGASRLGRVLFEDLSFDVLPEQRWVVLGPNGAGKSSMLAALAGVFAVSAGEVAVDGRPLSAWPPATLADRRAWCPQFWSDPFPTTVLDTVQLARHRRSAWYAVPTRPDAEVSATMECLELGALADADVRSLSGGQRQRVAIATALLQGAQLLLLDEPASHLDLGHQQLLLDLLLAQAKRGAAMVVSLHDLNLAWDLASHVVLLDGRGGRTAGWREAVMTPANLAAAFGVAIHEVEFGSRRRF